MKLNLLEEIRKRYMRARVLKVEPEFLEFEEQATSPADLERLLSYSLDQVPQANPFNSCLKYITGCSNEYDPTRRVDTIGGSPPDIDVDFDTLDYQLVIDWITNHYGIDNVASIMALQKFKPKSTVRKYFMVTEPIDEFAKVAHYKVCNEILSKIPPPLYGKEPTLSEIIKGNPEKKGYEPHPELTTSPKYKGWYEVATKLEGMISTFSMHAAGMVIMDNPVCNTIPLWFRKTKDEYSNGREVGRTATQFDMEEISALGAIKFDLLRVESLSVIKEAIKLIERRHGVKLNAWSIADGDEAAYSVVHKGLVAGVFQLEASRTAREFCQRMKPSSVEELSDLSALIRPGPLQAGLTDQYLLNRQRGSAPEDMPEAMAKVLANTHYVLVYQEQLMELVSTLGGFSLKDADNVRRGLGKKELKYVAPYREGFIQGCIGNGIDETYAIDFWDNVLVGYADYSFNKSHSCLYSYQTYVMTWLKANYTIEFFTALMSVRSKTLAPDKWSVRAPDYVREARHFGIVVKFPDINKSSIGFTIQDKAIYFGFSAIKKVGTAAATLLDETFNNNLYPDIYSFISRIDKSKINIGVFAALVTAGAFDTLGYKRQDLHDNTEVFYNHFKVKEELANRITENALRIQENEEIEKLIVKRDQLRKHAKKNELTEEEIAFLEEHKRILKKRPLALPEVPGFPELARYKKLAISMPELLSQGELLGCFLAHPAAIVYPNTTRLADINLVETYEIAGVVTDLKTYKNSQGSRTYITISDGTETTSLPIYSNSKVEIPTKGKLIWARIKGGCPESFNSEEELTPLRINRVFDLVIYGE